MKTKTMMTTVSIIVVLAAAIGIGFLVSKHGNEADGDLYGTKVILSDYTKIPVVMERLPVTNDKVNEYAAYAVGVYNIGFTVDRGIVEEGDTVEVVADFRDMENREVYDGISSERVIHVGSGRTYKELEQGVIGVQTGNRKEILVTLPDPFEYDESLSGLETICTVTVGCIYGKGYLELETLTDETAQLLIEADPLHMTDTGNYTGVDGFYQYVQDYVKDRVNEEMRYTVSNNINGYLLETCVIDPFPDAELAARMDKYIANLEETYNTNYGMTLDKYLESIGTGREEFCEYIESYLSDILRLELILSEIGKKEGIGFDEDGYREYLSEMLSMLGYESADSLYDEYGEDYVRKAYLMDAVGDWLIENADISYTNAEEANVPGAEAHKSTAGLDGPNRIGKGTKDENNGSDGKHRTGT